MKVISIIIVTCNSSKYIESCLSSILAQGIDDCEIILIDNGSKDNTVSIVKAKYQGIILIENPENFGPCYARNQGINKASGEFILCLDSDVKLLDNFLTNIYKAIKSEQTIGAVGPKILMSDARAIYSAGIYLSYLLRFHDIGDQEINLAKFEEKQYIFGASTAAVIYRKKALETIKYNGEYFDEDFFYLFEDVDISWRLQKKGWKILYMPDAVCLHVSGRSRYKDKFSQYLCVRNRYLAIIKNGSLSDLLRLFSAFFIYDLWRNIFVFITNTKYFLKACYETLTLFPKMLKKRFI